MYEKYLDMGNGRKNLKKIKLKEKLPAQWSKKLKISRFFITKSNTSTQKISFLIHIYMQKHNISAIFENNKTTRNQSSIAIQKTNISNLLPTNNKKRTL